MDLAKQEILLVDISIQESVTRDTQLALEEELARVNGELNRYTCQARKEEYALAIASGILAGMVDALYVGDAPLHGAETEEVRGSINKRVNQFIQRYASERGYKGDGRLKGAITYLEKTFPVAQDNAWSGRDISVNAKNHHLADLAHHPTPLGLFSAILVQFFRVGIFVNRNGEWHLIPLKTSRKEMLEIVIPAVITGFLNWLVLISATAYEEQTDRPLPKSIQQLSHLVASTPMTFEIAKCADNWFGHLVSDMGGSKTTAGGGMGIPGVFLSLLYEIAALPGLNKTGLPEYLTQLYTKQKHDMRHELVVVEGLSKQTIPVLLNEVLVRTGYLVLQLARQAESTSSLKDIDWREVIPIGNRTVDRMMTFSSLTLALADTTDAAVHASLESAGNWIVFSQRFVARYNYVAAGRAAMAIVREAVEDAKETKLLHEKRLLTEASSAFTIERLEAYSAQLEDRLEAFLQEDLEAFLQGFTLMDQGFAKGDSDLVIAGNIVIQKALGRESQFSNQNEFDCLMESDDDFIL